MNTHAIPLLFEDNHLLVVVKPAGIPVQADQSGDPDLLSTLKADIKIRHNKPGAVFLGLVHRLDRPVGGVMVFARTSKSAARLSEQIRKRTFVKIYHAVVRGCPTPPTGRLVHYLEKNAKTNTVRIVKDGDRRGKEAILEYEVLKHRDASSLVHVRLHTGRPHQIRVQMAAIGCPLIGDRKYGDRSPDSDHLSLWSHTLQFTHPTTKEWLSFQAPSPWEST